MDKFNSKIYRVHIELGGKLLNSLIHDHLYALIHDNVHTHVHTFLRTHTH